MSHLTQRLADELIDDAGGPHCGLKPEPQDLFNLRVASVFVLLVASTAGALFPVLVRPTKKSRSIPLLFDFAKYFGSGVIIATAFVHLLAPSFENLSSECLEGAWRQYQFAPALAMIAVFLLFFAELFAFRIGTQRLERLQQSKYDPHGHNVGQLGALNAHGPEITRRASDAATADAPPKASLAEDAAEVSSVPRSESSATSIADPKETTRRADHADLEHASSHHEHHPQHAVMAQIIGVAILEFGVVFHSVLVGLTLAVDKQFRPLFVVITLHQTFEGLGLGARLASLELPPRYERWVPIVGAVAYGLTTPIGIAAGLAVRNSYSPDQPIASIVSGIFDAVSAGILLYTGLVELLAHEFLFNPKLSRISNVRLLFSCLSMVLGASLMALLGRWA